MDRKITGVSAVNDEGTVIVFCEAAFPRFEYFSFEGEAIRLMSDTDEVQLTRTYGVATTDAARSAGRIVVQPLDDTGKPGVPYTVEAAHGRA